MWYRESDTPKFTEWLEEHGAEVQDPTNPYELVRFRTVNGISVIYTGKRGNSYVGEAEVAYQRFTKNQSWTAVNRKRKQLTKRKRAIADRDGDMCFWCIRVDLTIDDLTLEHILSKRHGGSDNIHNLSLACTDCQFALGALPVTKKLLLREELIKRRAHAN